MATVTLTWSADVDPVVVSYNATFITNGAPLPSISVPVVPGQTTYSVAYPNALEPGDVVGANVQSVDKFGQSSAPVPSAPPTVTVPPPAPPAGPTNVVLTLS